MDEHAAGSKHRRCGPANLQQIANIKAALRIPVIANGNIRCRADAVRQFRRHSL